MLKKSLKYVSGKFSLLLFPNNYENNYRHVRFFHRLKRLFNAALLLLLALGIGVLGFMYIEGYTFVEAFYMAIITLSTVGYGEVHPLSNTGRIFASFLIITNIGIFAYAISVLSSFIIDGDFREMVADIYAYKTIKHMEGHIIICGYGKFGKETCQHLRQLGKSFLVVDNKEETIMQLREDDKHMAIHGDATDDNVLKAAGIDKAAALVSALPDDAENLYIVLTARQLNPSLRIVSRAIHAVAEKKLHIAGADEVIIPEKVGGFYLANLVEQPAVINFLEILSEHKEAGIRFVPIHYTYDLKGEKDYQTIADLRIRSSIGVSVVAMRNTEGKYIINPSGDSRLYPNMQLILLGSHDQLERFDSFWNEYLISNPNLKH